MRKICLYTCFYLSVLSLPAAGRAGEAFPQVRVVARFKGQVFEDISPPKREALKNDIEKGVAKAFGDSVSFRCMKWAEKKSGSKAKPQAWLFVDLSQRNQGHSWIDLSFSGAVEGLPPELLWRAPGVADTWDHSSSKRKLKWLSDRILEATKAEILKPELRQEFDSRFISNVPIAYDIHVDHSGQRIVVPLDAKQLNLEPENLLKLELVASLCPPRPKGGCNIGLLSDAPWDGDLRCRLDTISCCPHQGWSSGVAKQLEERKPVTSKLFLARDHRHCQLGPDYCSGPDEPFRHPGSRP